MWDKRYAEQGFAYGSSPNDFVTQQVGQVGKNSRVLCLAEGEGRNAVWLAQQGFQVTAVDLSAVGLAKAEKLAQKHKVEIETIVADLVVYDLGENQWDAIVSIFAHMPTEIRKALHSRIGRALKDNGVFILEAYTKQQLSTSGTGGPPPDQQNMFMSVNGLREELSDLEAIHGVELTRHISEGKYHQGESAVVQFVGRKTESCASIPR